MTVFNRVTHPSLLLRSARIVLPHRVAEVASVLVEDGGIAGVIDAGSTESIRADSVIDLDGLTLFPGFIDVHIHGAVGVDTMAATSDDLLSVSQFLATQGVTGWLPTLVPAPVADYENAIAAIEGSMRHQAEATPVRRACAGSALRGAVCERDAVWRA